MSQDLALEVRAEVHGENTRKSAVTASGRVVGRHRQLRLKEKVHRVVVHDRREERGNTQEARVVHQALIDSVDPSRRGKMTRSANGKKKKRDYLKWKGREKCKVN